jgi:hypothetical protein
LSFQTPTAANFDRIIMPPTSDLYAIPYSSIDQTQMIRSPFPFAALNAHPTPFFDATGNMGNEDPPTVNPSAFSDTQFLMTLDDSYGFTDDASFSYDNWTFLDIDQSMGTGDQ